MEAANLAFAEIQRDEARVHPVALQFAPFFGELDAAGIHQFSVGQFTLREEEIKLPG